MLGKRSRSVRRIASVVSMGLECSPVYTVSPAEQFVEKQRSPECSSRCVPRQVVGFDLSVCLGKEEDNKPLPVTRPSSENQGGSPKSLRPTSGLESLFSSPRPPGKKNMQPVGLGFVATLDSGLEHPCESISSKALVAECCSMARGMAFRCVPHIACYSESRQKQSFAFGTTLKQSHPIPIAQSPLRQPVPQYKLQQHNSNQSSHRDPLHLGSNIPRKNTDGYPHAGGEVERCVFSLLATSPGTYEGSERVSLGTMDFMEACFLCKRHLGQGRDIFMYRGDKAFCSVECRHQQIVVDERAERMEKCSSVALKTGKVVQPRRGNHRSRVLAAGTAAAA
ncbi:hypothetical protein O6H91_02G022500 [Diphasiastrum complanatum]|uniref:Uncharacterized protein n=1 Tax=Diphasiastrum complanatum TaxID=34168 RepID=A0ACC2EE14_DIPCM|nr:hypothetical protein O6H91_Y360400 [Diphasiastrum complanatum]KAJ7564557.1 hypothetical protein O6H91_02G022500 [Diphasiastrum complanatum]